MLLPARPHPGAHDVTDLKDQIAAWLGSGLGAVAPGEAALPVTVERPKQAAHGDYASNVALQSAGKSARNC